ncbi:B-cell receptor CD22-like [Astyanax mexicanus]|uniref:B-cell receptor CD22-like n=1 Tax=Astyanax mexicanus TaxID=7994 RepID=UPI0020CADDB9|nr:B-cell receptor CD22-like [Astyanax mexicanus]
MPVRMAGTVLVVAVIMFLTGVQAQSVTLSSQSICAVNGSKVKISCTFTQSYSSWVREREWYLNSDDVERVLKKDTEFSERVSVNSGWKNCELTLKDVRVSDSGLYNFRFKTSNSDWISASFGVNLTVTDLQVKVDHKTVGQRRVKVTCSSTCSLGTNQKYIWYRNENRLSGYTGVSVEIFYQGRYSCGVSGSIHRSPSVCKYQSIGTECWGVTYTPQHVCALKGSSVDLPCSYEYPEGYRTVTKTVWFIKDQTAAEPEDLRVDKEYQERVQNIQNSHNDCSIRINNLRESDTQTYRFRFYTDDPGGRYTGQPGVTLTVTDLKVTLSKDHYGTYLTCSSTCSLTDRPAYIWYKNGQPLSNQHIDYPYLYTSTVGAGSYSCALKGFEDLRSPAVYSPRNTRAELVSSGEIVEGDSVTLSCSSDADPPVLSYSWFNQRKPAETPLSTEQNYSITSISSQNSGLYYCTAHNQLGHHSSTPIHLNVLYPPRNTKALMVSAKEIVEGDSVTLSCSSDADPPVLSYSWFNQREPAETPLTTDQNYSITSISSQNSGFYYCTACNRLGQHNSTPIHLNVLYPPRNLTLSHFVNGNSVTLMCVSDANPASSYTWYNKTGSDITPVGNSTNLTVAAGAHGVFYCMARNTFASYNSSEWLFTPENTSAKYAASAVPVVFLLIFIAVFLWLRKRAAATTSRSEENSEKDVSTPVYDNVPAMTSGPSRPAASDDEDDVQYSSVVFKHSQVQDESLYSTVQQPSALTQEEDEVEYATVNLVKQKPVRKTEEPIYSMVQKT